jgi:RHS repeat-associated protein
MSSEQAAARRLACSRVLRRVTAVVFAVLLLVGLGGWSSTTVGHADPSRRASGLERAEGLSVRAMEGGRVIRLRDRAGKGVLELRAKPRRRAASTIELESRTSRIRFRSRLAGRAWRHVAVRWSRRGVQLFLDGARVESYAVESRRGAVRTLRVRTASVTDVSAFDRWLSAAGIAKRSAATNARHGRTPATRQPMARAAAASGVLPPTNSALPTVSGTARDGQTLSSTTGTWSGVGNSYARQWLRCDASGDACVDIPAATQPTYVLAHADVGATIRVRVVASNPLGSNDATSTQTAVVVPAPPANASLPTIGGTTRDGQTLTVSAGAWSGTPPMTFAQHWRRCDSAGANCTDIPSQSGTTYALTPADVGKTIRAEVTATNVAGSAQALSARTAVIAPDPPSNTSVPVVSGVSEEGRDLTVERGAWTGTPTVTYAYQWQRCVPGGACASISGATATSYTLVAADVGQRILATVTATNAAGSRTAASEQTSAIATGAPFARSAPSISGTERDGQVLSAASGIWTGTSPIGYVYQWLRCDGLGAGCTAISGADQPSYTAQSPDVGHALRVRVTASNGTGSTTAESAASGVIAGNAPSNVTVPTITGAGAVGQQLTAQTGSWSGSTPRAYTYQWRRCDPSGTACQDIASATGAAYTATAQDIDSTVRVRVTATNTAGQGSATSAGSLIEEHACSTVFLPATGTWATASNWSTNTVPGAMDDVCIPSGRTAQVTSNASSVASVQGGGTLTLGDHLGITSTSSVSRIARLTMYAGGLLDGAADLTATSSISWTGGTMAGTGKTIIAADATGTVGGELSRTLINHGSLTASGMNNWAGTSSAVLDNRGTFTMNLISDSGFGMIRSQAGLTPKIRNSGTFRKTNTDRASGNVEWQITNTGTVQTGPGAGRIFFYGGGIPGETSTGSWSDVLLNGGTYAWGSGTQLGGSPTIQSATVDAAEVQGGATLAITMNGVLNLNGGSSTSHVQSLTLSSGTVSGAGNLAVAGGFAWNGGSMTGTGTTTLDASVSGSITGGTLGRTLVNHGSLTASTNNYFYGTSSAVLDNRGTFTQNISYNGGRGMNRSAAGQTPQIRNSGTFRKTSTDTPLGTVEWQIDNTGTVQTTAGAGELYFSGGGVPGQSGSGSWANARLTAGTFTWGAATQLAGPVAIAGATVSAPRVQAANADLTISTGQLTLTDPATPSNVRSLTMNGTGGTLDGAGDLTIGTGLTWSSGLMGGTGRTTVASTATGTIGGSPTTLSRTLVNHGSVTSTGDFSLKGTNLATLENYGTFTQNITWFQNRGLEPAVAGATPKVNNYGTFQKTASAALMSSVTWQFNNYGVVRADPGAGKVWFGGGTTAASNASGTWSGAALFAGNATWGPGTQIATDVSINGATVSVPDIQGTGDLTVWGGVLSLTDTTTTSHVKTLNMTNTGTLAGAGSLTVSTGFTWNQSGNVATTGSTTLAQTVNGTVTGGELAGRLTNKGRLTLPQGRLLGRAGGLLDNEGILDLNGEDWSTNVDALDVSPRATIWNRGVIRKTQGTWKTFVDFAFADQGVVDVQTGQLFFTGPTIGTGVGSDGSGWARGSESYGDHNDAIPGVSHCARAHPVNCTTGNLFEELTDLAVPGRGRPLTATRTYNAGAAVDEAAGLANRSSITRLAPGWTHGFATSLELTSGYAVLHGANDATATFKAGAGGTFTAAERVKAKLATGANSTYVLTYKDQTKDVFDSTGRLLRQLDRNGYQTTLTYDASGRLDHVTDEAGRQLSYTYDAAGRIATITDPLGRHVSYDYDARGDLTAATDAAGETWHYGYDAQHRMTSTRDPRGHETVTDFDTEGRVSAQTDPRDGEHHFAYTTSSTTVTDPRGFKSRYEIVGGLTHRVVRGVGTAQESTVTMVHDASGNVTQRIDPDDRVTKVTYDSAGNATTTTDPLQRVTTMTYSAANDVLTITDPQSTTTTMTYDAGGNVASVSRPLTGTSSTATTSYSYDPAKPGDLLSVTDPNGKVSHYTYDAAGNQISATNPEGETTTTAYNAIGWAISTVSPRGNVAGADPDDFRSTTAYNDRGQPVTQTDPSGASTTTAYDAAGNVTSVTEPGNKTTTTTYDELNRPTVVTRPDESTLRFAYDANGNRTSVKDGLNHETTFGYDALDRRISQTDAANRTTTYSYDRAGRQTGLNDAAGRSTTLAYDAASQLQTIDYSSSGTHDIDYDYDALGRRSAMTDASGTSSYAYDSLGRLTSTTDGGGRQLTYAHDLGGRLTKITYPAALVANTAPGQTIGDPSVTRDYDDAGRVTSITDWLGHETTFDYDANSNLTAQDYPNATSASLSYDRADRLSQRTDTGPGGTILDLPYTRKANGQVQTHNRNAEQPGRTETLGYDALDQLEQASSGAGASAETFAYAHDVADRLTQINTPDSDTTLEYDAVNELVRTKDTASGDVTQTFGYDQLGNRTSQDPTGPTPATTFAYDQANRLTSYTAPGVQRSYTYDGDGLRADLLWDHNATLPLVIGDSGGLYVTDPSGLPLAKLGYDATQRYYHHDQLGSTRALSTPTGTVTARYDFDAYGNPTNTPTSASNPFGYTGQYTDPATGLIYMRARWYDPKTGAFITKDPIGQDSGETNLYRYAAGDPVNTVDPTGLFALSDISDFAASSGDTLTLGGTKAIRRFLGIDNVDYCSSAYAAGAYVGEGLAFAVPLPGGGLTRLGAKGKGALSKLGRRLADERGSIGGSGAGNIGFGHGARHLAGTGLSRSEVEAAIEGQVRRSTAGATVGGSFGGRLTVGGQTIEYRGYGLPDGRINIGTYYPVP